MLSDMPNLKAQAGKHVVSIDGASAPTVVHDDYNAACLEAVRLLDKVGAQATHQAPIVARVCKIEAIFVSQAKREVGQLCEVPRALPELAEVQTSLS